MIKSKFSNRIYNYIHRYIIKYSCIIVSFYMKNIICKIKGVIIGSNNIFYGRAYIEIDNGGEIKIGNDNLFRSLETSNKMGLNHRCMISAIPYDSKECMLEIGNGCGFSGTTIRCSTSIKIGNNVRCGANTIIMDGDGHYEDSRTSKPKPIIICDNVFLGYGVVVKKGVTIGKNSVIGINSIVTHDIPENSIAVGIPCKVIKSI